MNENLHDTDDLYKNAYRQFEEEPSADVWEKINADLDKKDAESYKKSAIGWKRLSLLLLLLFGWCVMKLAVSSYNPFIYFNF